MHRRQFLAAAAAGATLSTAGCVEAFQSLEGTTYGREPPLVEDRPDAIYYPTHTEAMADGGMGMTSDGLHVHLMYTFPHRFWRVFRRDEGAGYESRLFEVGPDDAVHIMANIWDDKTGVVLPVSSVDIAARGGNDVDERETVYAMLSQRMGFHYGDNYHLDGNDTYTVEVTVGGVTATRFGDFEGRFGEPEAVTIEMDYSEATRDDLSFEEYPDRQGQPGAVEPMGSMSGGGMSDSDSSSGMSDSGSSNGMSMAEMPIGAARDLAENGGEPMGSGLADDVRYRAALFEAERFGGDPYLAVTASTRYNDLVVPDIGLSVTAADALESSLSAGLDPEIGFHYGTPASGLDGTESVELAVETPAQVARHEGYETAFLRTPTVTLA